MIMFYIYNFLHKMANNSGENQGETLKTLDTSKYPELENKLLPQVVSRLATALTENDVVALLKNLRSIPDFPIEGINYRDITTLCKNGECFKMISDALYEEYKNKWITKVVGIESRWYIMAAVLAYRLGAWFVPIRKPWKLPAETICVEYKKEYGKDCIEIHKDAIDENDVVLIHDDLLATWGTMKGAYDLVRKLNKKKVYVNSILEITKEWSLLTEEWSLYWRDLFKDEVEEGKVDIKTLIKL